jgi:hypothetical protein
MHSIFDQLEAGNRFLHPIGKNEPAKAFGGAACAEKRNFTGESGKTEEILNSLFI